MARTTKGQVLKLGRQIKLGRQMRGLSQAEAARLTGVNRKTWIAWEQGLQQPKFLDLENACEDVLLMTIIELRALNPNQ